MQVLCFGKAFHIVTGMRNRGAGVSLWLGAGGTGRRGLLREEERTGMGWNYLGPQPCMALSRWTAVDQNSSR